MEFRYIQEHRTLIVKVDEEIDHHTCELIRRKIDDQIQKNMPLRLLFDFSSVKFMDSSGIGVIIGRYKSMQRISGKAAVVNLKPQIRRIFEMSGILKLMSAYENIEQALASM